MTSDSEAQDADMTSLKSPLFEEITRDDFQGLEGYQIKSELDRQLIGGLVDPLQTRFMPEGDFDSLSGIKGG